jgi:hypothetical protein
MKPINSLDTAHSTLTQEETSQKQNVDGQLFTLRSSMKHSPLLSAIPQQHDLGFLTLRKTAAIQAYLGMLAFFTYAKPSDLQRLVGYSACISMIDYQSIEL